jgi:hypothetical protein
MREGRQMSQTDPLQARIELMEQSNRRLKWLTAVLGVGCAAALALSVYVTAFRSSPASSSLKVKSLAAENIVLIDPQGKPLAVLGEDDSWPWAQYKKWDAVKCAPEVRPVGAAPIVSSTGLSGRPAAVGFRRA